MQHAPAVAATLCAVALIWRLVPSDYLGIAWMALALVLLELGLLRLPEDFVVHSYAAAALGALRVWAFNLAASGERRRRSSRRRPCCWRMPWPPAR